MSSSNSDDLLILLDSEDSGFSQSNPATGTLYTASSDGTFTWTLSQPASPTHLDRLSGGFRVQNLSGDGNGTVNNGWEWQLEYQTNGTWTFSWYSVTSGTKSAAIQTQTNIGTLTNVRVILNANSLEVATSSDGVNYTSRGSTTSALYQTQTGISASYIVQTALGADVVLDGDMEDVGTAEYAAGNSASLTKETGTRTGGAGSQVLRVARNGVNNPNAQQSTPIAGTLYRVRGWLRSDGNAQPRVGDSAATIFTGTTSTTWQEFDFYHQFTTGQFRFIVITSTGTQYAEYDDVTIEKVQFIPDASGDGGFSQVVQS